MDIPERLFVFRWQLRDLCPACFRTFVGLLLALHLQLGLEGFERRADFTYLSDDDEESTAMIQGHVLAIILGLASIKAPEGFQPIAQQSSSLNSSLMISRLNEPELFASYPFLTAIFRECALGYSGR